MTTHYYLSVFPMEALVASQLDPEQFGLYMAVGSHKGSAEKIIFAEVEGEFGDYFNWDYAKKECVNHPNGDLKNSLYISVYRTLEHVPLDKIKSLYLTTKDGRTLQLKKEDYVSKKMDYMIYQELCPLHPMVVSALDANKFSKLITSPSSMIHAPKIIFADLKIIDHGDPENSGNIGGLYDKNVTHILDCIGQVTQSKGKVTKTLDRSHIESFSFNIIGSGIFIADEDTVLFFRLPSIAEIKQIDYDWGRSALII